MTIVLTILGTLATYWLLEWHFDVFGLIEKGMAININDVSLAVC